MSQYKWKKTEIKTYKTYKTYEQTKKWYEQMSPRRGKSKVKLGYIIVRSKA